MDRLGLSEELANAIVFIASDEASFITGHVLNVDGGKSQLTCLGAELRGSQRKGARRRNEHELNGRTSRRQCWVTLACWDHRRRRIHSLARSKGGPPKKTAPLTVQSLCRHPPG